jgi:hypothetical protein
MLWDHTRTERGIRVTCWSSFPLQGVHRFTSPRLSDMSTTCLWQSSHRHLNEFNELISVVLLNTLNRLQLLYDWSRMYLSSKCFE